MVDGSRRGIGSSGAGGEAIPATILAPAAGVAPRTPSSVASPPTQVHKAAPAASTPAVAAPAAPSPAAPPRPGRPAAPPRSSVLKRITCPHCWQKFPAEKLLWISRHAELVGDQVLGPEAPARFLPTRFNIEGQALDARGLACHSLACPNCHLSIPHDLIEIEPLFLSIIGAPSSGKSYFLASMTWELRRQMPAKFAVTLGDIDQVSNRALNEYEETLFLQGDGDRLVSLRKTELQGELYDQIRLGQQIVSLPRPFMFTVRPTARHPGAGTPAASSRVICLYDNAGEHFQPGMDTAAAPVTQHLAKSRVLMFLYDPLLDTRFRDQCRGFSEDPQLAKGRSRQRQDSVLAEAAQRVRRFSGLPSNHRVDRPLLVLVTKSDVWAPLLTGVDVVNEPVTHPANRTATVDLTRIEAVSAKLRGLMMEHAPEFVAVAEDFSSHVVYIPISALGRAPEEDAETKALGVRPKDISPCWVTVPVLYTFAKWSAGLIQGTRRRPTPGAA